ncbi:hypothetical protein MP228_004178 [Amoeboaphelidium protococcarum]|nr:hypothetical protein MP228_004178 [Amoeboaphelidium protococcarum]
MDQQHSQQLQWSWQLQYRQQNFDMDPWVITVNGAVVQPQDAFERIVSGDTKLGSKSTATLFIMALRHALNRRSDDDVSQLMLKCKEAETDFERKLAFRLLSSSSDAVNAGRPDKLYTLLILVINYAYVGGDTLSNSNFNNGFQNNGNLDDNMFNPQRMMNDKEQLDRYFKRLQRQRMAVDLLKQVLFITTDIRRVVLDEFSFVIQWICSTICQLSTCFSALQIRSSGTDSSQVDEEIASANANAQEEIGELLDSFIRCLSDVFIIAEQQHFEHYLDDLCNVLLSLQQVKQSSVIDLAVRLMSFIYEFANEETLTRFNDTKVIDQYLQILKIHRQQLSNGNVQLSFDYTSDILLTFMQHLATHLVCKVPDQLRPYVHSVCEDWRVVMGTHNDLNIEQQHIVSLQNFAVRTLHVLSSTGISVGIQALFSESVEIRKSRQLSIKRKCEGCGMIENHFGDFMMCAGCRKVRYCGKECQVKDWKYHRMSCHFFRPRPGFRSRGTQTPVDVQTQTELTSASGVQSSSSSMQPRISAFTPSDNLLNSRNVSFRRVDQLARAGVEHSGLVRSNDNSGQNTPAFGRRLNTIDDGISASNDEIVVDVTEQALQSQQQNQLIGGLESTESSAHEQQHADASMQVEEEQHQHAVSNTTSSGHGRRHHQVTQQSTSSGRVSTYVQTDISYAEQWRSRVYVDGQTQTTLLAHNTTSSNNQR